MIEILTLLRERRGLEWPEFEREALWQRYFGPTVVNRIASLSAVDEKPRVVFHPRQLLVTLLLAQHYCPDDGISTFADVGELLLKVSDLTENDDASSEVLESPLALACFFMPFYCDSNPPDPHLGLLRMADMLTDPLWGPSGHPGLIAARGRFEGVFGIPISEYLAVLFPLTGRFSTLPPDSRPARVDPTRIVARATDGPAIARVFALHTVSVDDLRGLASPDPRVIVRDRRYEPIRSRPLLEVSEGGVVCVDPAFLEQRIAASLKWTLRDLFSDPWEQELFLQGWGLLVEGYVHRRLPAVLRKAVYVPSPRDTQGNEITDALIDFGEDVVILEIKTGVLTETVKYEGTPETLLASLRGKFARNAQLMRAAERLFGAEGLARLHLRNARSSPPRAVVRVWPVLVSEDPAVCTPGVESVLNELLSEGETRSLPKSIQVKGLQVLSVDDLQGLLPVLRRGVSLRNVLRDRDAVIGDRLLTFNNYACKLSWRMGIERPFEDAELDGFTERVKQFWVRQEVDGIGW